MLHIKYVVAITLCIHTFSFFESFAQNSINGIPQIINYTLANQKAITQSWAVAQDKKGCMYFGNSFGITVFNGSYWQLVKLSNNSSVRSLTISPEGIIFAGGMDELGYLIYAANGTVSYTSLVDKLPSQNRDLGVVKNIAVINDDIFFLTDYYLLIYHNKNFIVVRTDSFFDKGYAVENRFFINERNIGLREVVNFKLITMSGTEIFSNDPPATILPTNDSRIIAVTPNHGAWLIDGRSLQQTWMHLTNLDITSGITLRNKQMLLGSVQKGLLHLDVDGNILMTIDKNIGLDNNNISCLFVDCFDNLWVGHDNGVSYVEISNPFSYINDKIVSGAGYAMQVQQDNLYLGTSQGLFVTDISSIGQSILPKLNLIKGTEGRVWNLSKIDNTLFLGHDKGTFIIKNDAAIKVNNYAGGWNYQKLKTNPSYMIEGCYTGILLYKKENNDWKYLRKIIGFDESSRVFGQDAKGRIWVAHGYKGIYRVTLDAELTKATEVKFYGKKNGFPSNLGINVFSVNNNLLFTSEYGGIYKYDEVADRFVFDADFESYLGKLPKVSKLSAQQNGNIWVHEVDRTGLLIKQSNGTFKYETQPFNKLKNELIMGFELFGETPDNKTLFGFGSGFICYDPAKRKDYNQTYYTSLYRIEFLGSKDSILFEGTNSAMRADTPVKLDYANNSLRFSFSAAYYEEIEAVTYTYYLENFDAGWSDYTKKTEREYTNLSEGTYTFHAKARNIYGTESVESVFTFRVNPPWYRTWMAFVAYFLFSAFAIIFLTMLYVARHERKLKHESLLKDRELIYLRNLKLHGELESKTKQLGTLTTLLVNKNAAMQKVKEFLNTLYESVNSTEQKNITALTRQLDSEADIDKEWQFIEPHFDGVHFGFLNKLKETYPALKPNDLRLCAYIRMNLSSKEIAVLMNNTTHGVEAHRYRLRKIFKIDRKDNFKEFLNSI